MTDSSTPMDSTVTEAVAMRVRDAITAEYQRDPLGLKLFERLAHAAILAMRSASLPSGDREAKLDLRMSLEALLAGEATIEETMDDIEALSKGEAMQAVSRPILGGEK